MINPEQVDEAICLLNSGVQENINEINAFLADWANSERVYESAFWLLTNSPNPKTKETASYVLKNYIIDKWIRMEEQWQAVILDFCAKTLIAEIPPELEVAVCNLIAAAAIAEHSQGNTILGIILTNPSLEDPFFCRKIHTLKFYLELGTMGGDDTSSTYMASILEGFDAVVMIVSLGITVAESAGAAIEVMSYISGYLQSDDLVVNNLLVNFLALPGKAPQFSTIVFDVFEALFLRRSEVFKVIGDWVDLILEYFASMECFPPGALRIICIFLRKYWGSLTSMLFQNEHESLLKVAMDRLRAVLGRVNVAVSGSEPVVNEKTAYRRQMLFHVLGHILVTPPEEDDALDWWNFWKDFIRRFVFDSLYNKGSEYTAIMGQIYGMILPVIIKNAHMFVDGGQIKLEMMNLTVLRCLLEENVERTLEVFSKCSDINVFYLIGCAPNVKNDALRQCIKQMIMTAIAQANNPEGCCALLFVMHRKVALFTPEEVPAVIDFAVKCLQTGDESVEIAAATALYYLYNRSALSFNPEMFLTPLPTFMAGLCESAAVKMTKLCASIISVHEISPEVLVTTLIQCLSARPKVALEALGEIMFVALPDLRRMLFTITHPIVMEILAARIDDLEELVLTTLAAEINHIEPELVPEYIDSIVQYLMANRDIIDLGMEFLAQCRLYNTFFDRYIDVVREIVCSCAPSKSMFRMLVSYGQEQFPGELVVEKLTQGLKDMDSSVSNEAIAFCKHLLNYSVLETYEGCVKPYRVPICGAVISALLDGFHMRDFKGHCKILSMALHGALEIEGTASPFIREFTMLWKQATGVADEALVGFVTTLAKECSSRLLFQEALAQYIVAFDAPKTLKAGLVSAVNECLLHEIEERMGFGGDLDVTLDFTEKEEPEDEEGQNLCEQMKLLSVAPMDK